MDFIPNVDEYIHVINIMKWNTVNPPVTAFRGLICVAFGQALR